METYIIRDKARGRRLGIFRADSSTSALDQYAQAVGHSDWGDVHEGDAEAIEASSLSSRATIRPPNAELYNQLIRSTGVSW